MMNRWAGPGFKAKLAVSGIAASALVAMMSAAPAHAVVGPKSNGFNDPGNPTSVNIPETATVSGGTASPRIECGWALPDNNPVGGAETSNTDTTAADYNGNNGSGPKAPSTTGTNAFVYGANDDDPATTPTNAAGAPATPCQLGYTGQPNPGSATQSDGALHMVQVLPNADNTPAERRIELWSAVDDTQGISNLSSVYWDIKHPDGTLKYEIFGVPSSCYGAEGSAGAQPMFAEAVSTGQVSSTAVSDPTNGMIALCNEGVKTLWHQAFDVSKDQPNGSYLITETAVDKDGNVAQLTYSLDIISFFDLAVDFTSVSYGTVSANSASVIAGDTNFLAGDGRPTVTNRGNSGEQIGLAWGPMIGKTLGKCINNFDAKFGTFGPGGVNPASNASLLQAITGVATCPAAGSPNGSPSAEVDFNGTGSQLLCPNDDGKLDLSIDPQLDTPPPPSDTYSGSLTVVAKSSVQAHNGCPTDNGSVYTPNSGTRTT